jgi:two-component system, LytTR family, sensor kinase
MKHPVLENRVRHLVWWLVWLIIGLGQSALFYFAYNEPILINIIDGAVSFILFSILALAIWFPFNYLNSFQNKPLVIFSNLLGAGAITVVIWIGATELLFQNLIADPFLYKAHVSATLPYRIGLGIFFYGLVILTYYLFTSLANLSEKKGKEAQLESLLKETELKMLRSQINPHFLFNSLNSISSLTITDPEKARDMVVKLSEFMRYSLSRRDEQPVSLKSELENITLYLEIEKVRFGDKLSTEETIEADCYDFKIPVLLLQPLYENAVKHGVYESTESVRIITRVKFINGYLEIAITNNFDPAAILKRGTGTGLLNVTRRLELYYGKKASMITSKENGLYTVTLYIPAENQKFEIRD